MQQNNYNFEDVIVRYGIENTENVTAMAGFLFNFFHVIYPFSNIWQSVNFYVDEKCNTVCLLLKDLIRFNTNDKKLETKLKDQTNKGLVFNSLKARWNYLKKLEIFQCESQQFLDFIAEDQEEKRWMSYSRLLKLLKNYYTDVSIQISNSLLQAEAGIHKDILRQFLFDLDLFKTLKEKGKIKKFVSIFDLAYLKDGPDLSELEDE